MPIEESGSEEEREGFEAYSEQQVIAPTADEVAPTQIRVEKKGKHRAETEDNNTYELLILIQ